MKCLRRKQRCYKIPQLVSSKNKFLSRTHVFLKRKLFDCSNVDETVTFVFAQLFWCNAGIPLNFFDEMILVCEILFRKKFAFTDVLERRSETKNVAICFERNSKLLIEVTIDLPAAPIHFFGKFFYCY